ncbi:MAG: hypothetical protein KatS3mg060_2238 [Dehalococcoidia bacterium]|nr:MAG: hypothetical protein KatS3mg060_2238 [Dehalococcoidia bacterium]
MSRLASQAVAGFFDEWSPPMAYVLGYAFADGHVAVDRAYRTYRLELGSADQGFLLGLRELIGCSHVRLVRFSHTWAIRISGVGVVHRLAELGLEPGRHSGTMRFPEVPGPYLAPFVRGYFDGDGSVSFHTRGKPRVIFYSRSRAFLEGLAADFERHGLGSRVPNRRSNRPDEFYLLYGVLLSRRIRDWMYSDNGYRLERKWRKLYGTA